MTQGGQIASMRIRMFSQIAISCFTACLFFSGYSLVWFYGKNKLADVCERLYLLVVYHAEGMRDLIKSQPVYEIQYYGKPSG